MKNRFEIDELLRFLVGGGSAVICDYLTYHILLSIGMKVHYSKAVSFICGSIIGFIINKLWTFESKKFFAGEVIRYALLYSFTVIINTGVNQVVIHIFNFKLLAFFAATGVCTILNLLGQKFFVFRK